MTTRSYEALHDEAMELYGNGAYGEVLALMTREGDQFPDHAPDILYLRSCMAARVGQPDLAIDILRDALDRGIWYGARLMRHSPSWQGLQGLPAFEQIADACKEREAAAQTEARFFTRAPEGGCGAARPCPALIALHGNGSNGPAALAGWAPVVAAGWLLAALQSSQIGEMDAYLWDDPDTALRDLATQFAALETRIALDPARLLLAGFSLGGETALRAALAGTIPARGFILLGPGGPTIDTPEAWLPLLPAGAARGLRGYIFLGAEDAEVPHEEIRRLSDLLNKEGIPCRLEVLPGIRHAYPPDFAPSLRRALAFVLPAGDAPAPAWSYPVPSTEY